MALIIPSIFTAVDKFSPTVAKMGRSLSAFEQKLSKNIANSERLYRHTNMFSDAASNMFEQLKGAAEVAATIGISAFTLKSVMDYEDAVASFRTIVSDLNNTQFSAFEQQIGIVAKETRKSSIDVANSFEKIAGLNPEFAKTAESIGAMSSAAITLAKASRMELGASAESLTGIMNQFNYEAGQANRTINVLAAGQAVGAASITQTATSLTKFGSTAKASNVSLEQSVALIELFAEKGFFAEDAGFKLNSGILKLQGATLGYKSGAFSLIDALTELKTKYDAIGTAAAKDAYLTKVFDITQINTGRILLENVDKIKQYTQSVTGTNEATKAAEIQTNTLSNRLSELSNKWVTIVTTAGGASKGLNAVKSAVVFLTNNLEGLATVGAVVIGTFAVWKASILAQTGAVFLLAKGQAALNFLLGIGTVITRTYATSCFATTAGIRGMATASFFLEMGLWGTLGVVGLVSAALFVLYSRMTDDYQAGMELRRSLDETAGGFRQLREPITQAQIALDKYNSAMDAYNDKQDFTQHRLYSYNRGLLHGLAFDITHPLDIMQGGVNNPTGIMPTPEKQDFFSGVTPGNYKVRPSATDTTPVYLNVNVDKSGAVSVSGDNVKVMNSPQISSTSQ